MVTSASPISRTTAEHYVWGAQCEGWHLVRTAGLSIIEERMPPGTCEVRHWHARARQFFYVISGTLSMEIEGECHELTARTGIELAPGLAHQATNATDRDVEFLVVSLPPSHGDRHEA
jgi:mannose-6-phosphate isomerase-like protein (cupin superfamily)